MLQPAGAVSDGTAPASAVRRASSLLSSKAFWDALIGMIFLMPLAGAAIGAASGALGGALTDVGINDQFMKEGRTAPAIGQCRVAPAVRKVTTHKVLAALQGEAGR